MDLWQSPKRLAHLPRGEDDRDPSGSEPASREHEHLGRRTIEPVGVVDHTEEAALPGGLRQQSENRERNEEPIRRRPRTQPERDIERVTLRSRQALSEFKDRRAQLLNRSEWELHLAFD